MKEIFIYLKFFATLVLIISCETNPPISPDQNLEFGKVFVNSDIDGAEVYVDNISTSKFVPDTIEIKVGEHEISLVKEGYTFNSTTINVNVNSFQNVLINSIKQVSKVVLIEDFANVSCDPCVISNAIIEELDESYDHQVVVVKYSANFPSPTDPFYLSATDENNARMSYYNILFAPTIIIDGIERPIATDENDMRNTIDLRLGEDVLFEIIGNDTVVSNTYSLNIEAMLINNSFDYSNCKLFVIAIEKEISFNDPPGSNGETVFYHVMRGIKEFNLSNEMNAVNLTAKIETSFDIRNEWEISNITAAVFIQNFDTKEIYQAYLIE